MKREKPVSVRFSRQERQALQERLNDMKARAPQTNLNRFIRECVMKELNRSQMT